MHWNSLDAWAAAAAETSATMVAASCALPTLETGIPLTSKVWFSSTWLDLHEKASKNMVEDDLFVDHLSQQYPTPDQAGWGLSPNRTCFWNWKGWSGWMVDRCAPVGVDRPWDMKLNTSSQRSTSLWDAPTEGKSLWLANETWSTCICSCNCAIANWWLWVQVCAVESRCSYWETVLPTAFWISALWLHCRSNNSSYITVTWLFWGF